MDLPPPASIGNQNNFLLTLAKQVILSNAKNLWNSVFSPVSLQALLALIAAGSSGPTRDQLLSFLNSNSTHELNSLASRIITVALANGSPSGGPLLSFAHGVWIDQSLSLKASFKNVVDDVYKAASHRVDFVNKPDEVTNEVNAWVEKGTNGLIKNILCRGAVNQQTRLILANAIYFKGVWEEKFDALKTKEHDFHLLDGSTIKAPFMTSMGRQYINAYDDFKVLRLPHKQGEDKRSFSMYIFLPDAKNGLPALMDKVTSRPGFLEHHLPRMKVIVGDFRIPKFKISFGFEATETLKELGLVLPFEGGGLTEMVDSPAVGQNLSVSNIFHESFIEVNEEGTEAAAATVGLFLLRSRQSFHKEDFVADHPFLFVIREDMSTQVLLFIGSVVNPVAS